MTFDYESEQKETVGSCNLCGREDFEQFAERDRYGLAVKTVRCKGCGLVFINPRMTAAGYRRFYADGYYRTLLAQFYGKPMEPAQFEESQRHYAEALAAYLEPHISKRLAEGLLDVGGSAGVVAETFRRRFGLKGTVLEPSDAERALAAKRGLKTMAGTIEGFSRNGRCWDVVLMCQTVDHLLDIAGALRKLRRAVSSRGFYYMDVACFDLLIERPWVAGTAMRVQPEKVVKVDHPYYLSRDHAERYLAKAGFRVIGRSKGPLRYQVGYVCKPNGKASL